MVDKKTAWVKFMESLPFVEEPPGPQWLSPTEYGSRATTVPQAVRRAVEKGTIKRKHLLATRNKVRAGYKLLIDWNETAYDFIRTRRKRSWPNDFNINSKSYRPIHIKKEKNKKQVLSVESKRSKIDLLDNIQDAKLEMEKLKIAEKQREHQIADNELIPIEHVVAVCVSMAHAVKSQLMRFITLASPDLLSCDNVQEIRLVCEKYFKEVLSEVETLVSIKDKLNN